MNLRVLIVDDEPPARERLRSMLVEFGEYDVAGEAGNGGQALDLVDRLNPDIVLLDVRMPGIDGLEVARHLAALPEPPEEARAPPRQGLTPRLGTTARRALLARARSAPQARARTRAAAQKPGLRS